MAIAKQPVATAAHCINPDCPHPYPQNLGSNFCTNCGSTLRLKDRYIPLQRLGFGGFSAIYTVWDASAKTERVLKVLLDASPKALALFEQEAIVLANLRHPGVPRVEPDSYFQIILGNYPQRLLPCLVMEKIIGQTLEDILEHNPQGCPEAWVLNWLKQTVDILRRLHKRQIIHRDIKPSNLMLRHPRKGQAETTRQIVLIDFGGAKQINSSKSNYQVSSTRLFSPGYSPPEQITGGVVGSGTDFYALGMTCIHLLTGKYPLDLEDPVTGELKWRNGILINPVFADLLDDMVRPEADRRPATASEIRTRILKIYRSQITPRYVAVYCLKLIAKIIVTCFKILWAGLVFAVRSIKWIISSVFRFIFQLVKTGANTILTMLIAAIGAGTGAASGFWFAHQLPIGERLADFLTTELPHRMPNLPVTLKPEILLFAAAGWGTAWSLSHANSLGKCLGRWAGQMGILGYLLGWLIWQGVTPDRARDGLVGMSAIAVYFLTLGLGLRSHQLVYAVVTAAGVAIALNFITTIPFVLNLLPSDSLASLWDAFSHPGWSNLTISVAFFSLLGVFLGFWLAVSHYLFIPFLRLLGWK